MPISQQLVRVERLRTVDGQPLSYEQTYVDLRAYPDFLEFNLTQSIYQMLQFNYGTTIQSVEETIEVIKDSADRHDSSSWPREPHCCVHSHGRSMGWDVLWWCPTTFIQLHR